MITQWIDRRVLAVVSLLFVASGVEASWQSDLSPGPRSETPRWTYSGDQGPEHWGQLAPEYAGCATGSQQSPVNIVSPASISMPCDPLRFRYRSSSLFIANDGAGLRVGYDRGSYLVAEGLSYELVEMRFHVPGEHRIDGGVPDAELQLVHASERGDIAIVAVPIVAGTRHNQMLRRVLDNAPELPGEQYYGRNVGFNPVFLLPGRKDYFAYEGSLTVPPCREGVHWYVFRNPLEVKPDDIRRLARLVGNNARPVQALRGRQVRQLCGT